MFGYRPKHFALYELVPRREYEQVDHDILWSQFDSWLLWGADGLRDRWGPMVCNDWWWGGRNQFRGYRPSDCGEGADYSMHRIYRALDLIPVRATAKAIRDDMRSRPWDVVYRMIRRVEAGVGWLHIDMANRPGATQTYFFQK